MKYLLMKNFQHWLTNYRYYFNLLQLFFRILRVFPPYLWQILVYNHILFVSLITFQNIFRNLFLLTQSLLCRASSKFLKCFWKYTIKCIAKYGLCQISVISVIFSYCFYVITNRFKWILFSNSQVAKYPIKEWNSKGFLLHTRKKNTFTLL